MRKELIHDGMMLVGESRIAAQAIGGNYVGIALLALVAPLLLAFMPATTPAAISLDAHAGAAAAATARLVGGIIEYSRWPDSRAPVRLCVIGPVRLGGQLGTLRLSDGRSVERRDVDAAALDSAERCDVLYMGNIGLVGMMRWVARVRGGAVLTIAEQDRACRSEAMFCLIPAARSLSFQLNIDAVARSGMRVDPRVLRLAQGEN
ncbi:MAG: YfiR family protein [Sphingomonadaceae bacterium]|nr:YfiR family protein [Sphingomonadaceae bacterium]